MSRTPRPQPAELAPGWPGTLSTDPAGEAARQFALRLRDAIGDDSIRSVARSAGLSHVTLLGYLNGSTWPDLYAIARLETALGVPLKTGQKR
ncbi:helix-turn-helix domain-containing protein [Agromyces sp. NPDC056965]|uniref:helix-turn-helix domain-containing protein n=1 Tax=Agromyces sp. NPDC056965 TaxID=3345983 RepID=UPI0036376586